MKTKAVRMYGTRDLRLEEFELPIVQFLSKNHPQPFFPWFFE